MSGVASSHRCANRHPRKEIEYEMTLGATQYFGVASQRYRAGTARIASAQTKQMHGIRRRRRRDVRSTQFPSQRCQSSPSS